MEDFCTCKKGTKGRNICSCFSSDRHWCSICKKTILMKPDTEEEKQKRKEFLKDCHCRSDIIIKSVSSELDWQEYKNKKRKRSKDDRADKIRYSKAAQ